MRCKLFLRENACEAHDRVQGNRQQNQETDLQIGKA
jgi:hypothetical protein